MTVRDGLRTLVETARRRFHTAVDYVCYIFVIKIFVKRTLLLFLVFAGLAAILHFLFKMKVDQGTLLAALLASAPKIHEIIIAEFKGLFTADKRGNKQVKDSVDLHVQLLQMIERLPTAQTVRAPSERTSEERRVIVNSIKLIDSVIRERMHLHDNDDVHTTLRVGGRGLEPQYFYEKPNKHLRAGGTRHPHRA